MNDVILEYPLTTEPEQWIDVGGRCEPMTVQMKNGVPTLFAIINKLREPRKFLIMCKKTGEPFKCGHWLWFASVQCEPDSQIQRGPNVLHYFYDRDAV